MKIIINKSDIQPGKDLYELAIEIIQNYDCIIVLKEMKTIEVEKNTGNMSDLMLVIAKYIK